MPEQPDSRPHSVQAVQGFVLLSVLGAIGYCALAPSEPSSASPTPSAHIASPSPPTLEEMQARDREIARAYLNAPIPVQAPETPAPPPPPTKAAKPTKQAKAGPSSSAPADEPDGPIRPEMTVRFPSGTFGCATPELLIKLVGHLERGEVTKADSMGRVCTTIRTDARLKVLSLGTLASDPPWEILEVVPARGKHSKASDGIWVIAQGAVPTR